MGKHKNGVTLQWVGDISLNEQFCNPQYHRPIAERMARLRREAGPCDLRIGNFESPLWGDGSVNELRHTRICTTKEAAECIVPLGLDVVFLGNNHVYDCREAGFENTVSFLRKNGIGYLGAGTSPSEAARPLILERRGLSLGFLNYLHPNTNPTLPADARVFPNYFEEKVALANIADLSRQVDVVLVYLHWGQQELIRLPSLEQRQFGRRAVETGAAVVMFDHAHCLQPHEAWRNGHIFYGLGNFIFGTVPGQDWPDRAYRTAVVKIVISAGRVDEVHLRHLYLSSHIPDWDSSRSRARAQRRLDFCIRRPDRTYHVLYAWERLWYRAGVCTIQFIKRSGGLLPALFTIRKHHLIKILRAMTSPVRR